MDVNIVDGPVIAWEKGALPEASSAAMACMGGPCLGSLVSKVKCNTSPLFSTAWGTVKRFYSLAHFCKPLKIISCLKSTLLSLSDTCQQVQTPLGQHSQSPRHENSMTA